MLDIKQFILTGSPVDDLVSILHYVEAQKYLGIPDDFGQTGQTRILKYGVFEIFYRKYQLCGMFAYKRHINSKSIEVSELLSMSLEEIAEFLALTNLPYRLNERFRDVGSLELELENGVVITIATDSNTIYNIGRNWGVND